MKTKLITFDDLKLRLDAFDIQEITNLKYHSVNRQDFNYQLFCLLEIINKYYPVCNNPLNLGLFGNNIDYDNIYYSL